MGETQVQRDARRHGVEMRRSIGRALAELREDGGLTRTAVADAAGMDRSFLGKVERGERSASLGTLTAIATVLGADLTLRAYPTTGPRIRDHIQAAMVEALLRILHTRWTASPEVPVYRPPRGVIDLVLSDAREALVIASEMHSELRRLEQQVRWHREKEASLPSADLWHFATGDAPAATSRLLVLRSTRTMRELANAFVATLRATYPARSADVLEALTTGSRQWPGPGIVWVRVEGSSAVVLDGPPRGVRLGR
jgi:transcriptional regulator with XRE-family HTH domain